MNKRNLSAVLVVSIGTIALIAGCDANRAIRPAPFSVAPGAIGPSRQGTECRVTDDEATKTRTLSGACSQTRIAELAELAPGWKIRSEFTAPSGRPLKMSRVVVPGSCSMNCPTYWTQPDSSYLSATAPIPAGPYTWVYNQYPYAINPIGYLYSDGTLTVTFDEQSKTGPVAIHPDGYGLWNTWGSPPVVDSMYPDVIYVNNSSQWTERPSVGMKLSVPVTSLGFEMEPNWTQPTSSTITYYSAGSPIGSVSVDFPYVSTMANGAGSAQLIAINSPMPFDSVVIGNPNELGFAIANLRYAQAAASLTIVGPDSATRGDSVTFIARRTTPGSPNVVATKWTFTSTDTLLPGYVYDRTDGTPSDSVWSGRMAASGKIHVEATISGVPQSADWVVRVVPRNWSTKTVVDSIHDSTGVVAQPALPDSVGRLGGNFMFPQVLVSSPPLASPSSGPNTGVMYFTEIPFLLHFTVFWNDKALAVNSAFYNDQLDARTGPWCAKADVLPAIDGVKAHEGFARDTNSHSNTKKIGFLKDARIRAERMVGNPLTNVFTPAIDTVSRIASDSAKAVTIRITHGNTTNPWQTTCEFRYRPQLN